MPAEGPAARARGPRALWRVLGLLALACPSGLSAEQFVLVDETRDFRKPFTYFHRPAETPRNWVSPVNYTEGTVHVRLEVFSKPTGRELWFQVCWFFPGGGTIHHCTHQDRIKVVGPGVYEMDHAISRMWRSAERTYEKGISRIMAVCKDNKGTPIGWKGFAGIKEDYFPMKARLTVVVVSKGGTYRRPGSYGGLHYEDLTELKNVADLMQRGQLGPARVVAGRELASPDPKRAAEARRVIEALDGHLERRRAEITQLKREFPLRALEALSKLARQFSPVEKSRELSALAREWAREPATVSAMKAQKIFDVMKKTADGLKRKLGGTPASDPGMMRRYRRDIETVARCALLLRKKFPDTPSCRRALAIVQELGIRLPE